MGAKMNLVGVPGLSILGRTYDLANLEEVINNELNVEESVCLLVFHHFNRTFSLSTKLI